MINMNKLNKIQIISVIAIVIVLLLVIFFSIQKKISNNAFDKEVEKPEVEELKYKIDGLEKSEYNDKTRKNYRLYEESVNCNIYITADDISNYNNYKDGEEYIKSNEMMYIGDIILADEIVNINNNEWHYIHIRENRKGYDRGLKDSYYYSIIKNKKVYLVTYEITDLSREADSSNSLCIKEKDEFINSLKFN